MIFEVTIEATIDIEADSKDEAIEKVKDKFYDEILTVDDLYLSAEKIDED